MSAVQFFLPYDIAIKPTNVGAPGALLYVYAPGGTTKLPAYASSSLTTQLSNPVLADGAGRFPAIYLDNALTYKIVIADRLGAQLYARDPYIPGQAPDSTSLQPYADNAAASAASATTSATSAAGSATNAATSASAAASSATAAATSATNSAASATSASASAAAASTSIANVPNATAHALTRTALSALGTGSPAYLHESGREGTFVFDAANHSTHVTNDPNQGVYVAPASDTTGASGAWVRKFSGSTSAKWFGATGDGVTNDSASIVAALAFLQSIAGNPITTIYKASGKLFIPAGKYYCGTTTIDITHTLTIEGEGGGGFATGGGCATMLQWDDGVTGIRIQEYNTTGASTVIGSPYHLSGACTILRGLYLYGGFSSTESESHGIHVKARTILDDVQVDNFAGDGLYAHTSSGGGAPNEGNSNCSRAYNSHFRNCRNGISITGGDANAWLFLGCFFDYNRTWGVNDTSFLGNSYIGCHQDSNGITIPSAAFGVSVVSNGGNRYAVVVGQEATASVTAPTGTVDTANWIYMAAGAVAAPAIPAWISGMTLRAGGAMLLRNNNANSYVAGNYTEAGQAPIQQTALGVVVGGSNNTGVKGGSWVRGGTGSFFLQTQTQVLGQVQILQSGGASALTLEGVNDPNYTVNPSIFIKSGIPTTGTATVAFLKSDGSTMGKAQCIANLGLYLDALLGITLRYNGGDTFVVNSTGVNLPSGKNLQYNGTAVLTGGILTAAAFPAQTGDVTNTQGSLATTIAPNVVTYAKFQQVAASSLVGNATGSLANAAGITLAGGLAFSGTTLTVGALTPTSVAATGTVTGSNLSGTNTGDETSATVVAKIAGQGIAPASSAATGAITSSGATAGVGYATGAGGAVTQLTSKSTGVTLSKVCGQITTSNAALASATGVSFTVTNTAVAATDTIDLVLASGNATSGTYNYQVDKVSAGSFVIWLKNISAGSLSEALVFNFSVKKAVAA